MKQWTSRIINALVIGAMLFGLVAYSPVAAARANSASYTTNEMAGGKYSPLGFVINTQTGVLDCSFGTCSYYYTRYWTRWIAGHWYWAAAAAVLLGLAPHPAAKAAAAGLTVSTLVTQGKAKEAAAKNQCLRIRFLHSGVIVGIYSSGNRFCKN